MEREIRSVLWCARFNPKKIAFIGLLEEHLACRKTRRPSAIPGKPLFAALFTSSEAKNESKLTIVLWARGEEGFPGVGSRETLRTCPRTPLDPTVLASA
jgi:hypothetical protein